MSDSYTPTENSDLLATTSGDDVVSAQGGDDTITGSTGNDVLDGGTGFDQVDYSGNSGDYIFSTSADGSIQVTKPDGSVDTLRNINGIWFAGDQAWRSIDELVQTAGVVTDGAVTDTDETALGQIDYEGNSADYWFSQNSDGSIQVTKPDGTTETLQDVTGIWFAGDQVWRSLEEVLEVGAGSDPTDAAQNQVDYEGNSADYGFEQNADGSIKVTKPDGSTETLQNINGVWFAGDQVWRSMEDLLEDEADTDTTTGTTEPASTQVDYEGKSTDYWFEQNADGSIKVTKPDGTIDTLTDIQSVWFAGDQVWSFVADLIETEEDTGTGTTTTGTTGTTEPASTQVDYEGKSTDYGFEKNADGSIKVTKPDGTIDTLTNIQSVWFAGDQVWSFVADLIETEEETGTGTTTTGTTEPASTQVDYEGKSTDYWFEKNADGSIKVTKPDGTIDTLTDVQSVWFAGDQVWSFVADLIETETGTGTTGTTDTTTTGTDTDTGGNTAPVAADDWVKLTSGEQTMVNVLGNDSDADGDGFYISAINGKPMKAGWSTWVEGVGEVSVHENGTLCIESAVEGNFSFQYTITDANGASSTATVEGTSDAPAPANTGPVANDDWLTLTSGEPTKISVLGNDTDDEIDSIYVSAINGTPMQPGWKTWVEGVGLVTVVSKCTLSIESEIEGNFSFEYTITDADGQTSTAIVEGTTEAPAPVNAAPVATDDVVAVVSGEPTTINVLGNDSDAEGDAFYISAINGTPMQPGWSTWIEGVGEVSLHENGTLCIESAVEGDFSFQYTITDANGSTSTATVAGTSAAPAPVNATPVATDDVVDVVSGEPTTINVLGNDSDAEGDAFYISAIDGKPMQPGWSTWIEGVGEVSLHPDGTLCIESAVEGNFSFEYTITDANGGTSTATVEGTSTAPAPVNAAPTAVDDHVALTSGETTEVTVLANDSDADGDAIHVSHINGTPMQIGWKTWVEGVGLITVIAPCTLSIESAVEGGFSFDYTITDSNGATSTATVEGTSAAPAPEITGPVASNDWVALTSGESTTLNVLGNDTDTQGDGFHISAINGTPMQPGWNTWVEGVGVVTINNDGTLSVESAVEGDFSFQYTITDANGGTSTATVEGTSAAPAPVVPVVPEPVNVAPIALDDALTGTLGEAITVSPLANDSDADGDDLHIVEIDGKPMQAGWVTWVNDVGLVTLNADNTITVQPAEGVSHVSFGYTICDGNDHRTTATISGTLEDIPNTTDAVDDTSSTEFNTPITIDVLYNDVDAEGDAFSITSIGNAANGTVSQNADGKLIYTPNDGFSGTDTFTYTITDAKGMVDTATVTVDVQEQVIPNTTDAIDDAAWTEFDKPVEIDVLGNDKDAESDAFSVTGFANGANGTVSQGADGKLIYTPNAGFSGTDTFTYTITDAKGAVDTATVTVDVQEQVIPNTTDAVDDASSTKFDTPVTIDVLGNDKDAESDAFSVTGFANGANGTVSQGADGKLIYTPNAGFSGTDTFTYTITDAKGAVDTATVTVDVQEQVIPNTTDAVDDASSTKFDTPVTIDVLGNDKDAESDAFSVTGFANGANGTVSQGADGKLIYTPNAGFSGTDTFTYTITDAKGAVDTATVTVDVQEQVIPNTTDAVDDASSTKFDTPVTIDVLGNDKDAESDAFSVTGFANGANGTVSQGADGKLIYTPNAGFSGTDTFTYTITDTKGAVDTATVTVDVQEQVIPNTTDAIDDAAWTEFDKPVEIDVLGNDKDAESDAFSVTGFANGANGTVSQGTDGKLIYTPNAGFSGTDTFTYTITDAKGAVDTATVTVDVQEQVIPNTTDAVDDAAWTEFDKPVEIDVLGNDKDAESDAFSVTGFANGANGTVSQGADGKLIYTPNAGFSGTDTFTYTITDAKGAVDTATVTVDVQEQVIPNTTDAVDDTSSTKFDTPVTIDVLGNDKDAESDAFSITGIGKAENGTVSQNADGKLVYTPNAGFSGTDTFTYTITDANGAVDTATVCVDVEPQIATGAIGDRVWLDADGDGLQDDGEVGIAGVTVNLMDASGTILNSQQTDANGNYWFDALVAGDYYIGVVAPDDYNFTTQDVGNNNHGTDSDVDVDSGMSDAIHLKEGQIVASADAGLVSNATASVGDRIWHDANGNGVQDNGEVGAKNITVQLKDANGTIIQSQQTDGNGNYLFENVAAGSYSLGVVAPDGYGFTEQDAVGSRSHNDSDVDVDTGMTDAFDVKEGAALTNVDAGLVDTSTQTGTDNITTCEDETSTFNVLDNDQGNDLRLVNVAHETPELQAEFEARGGALSFDADGNVTYTGMSDYYGNDVLIYTLENANGQSFTDRVEMTIEAVSDAAVLDVTDDFQQGRAGYREDTSYQKHITHHSTAERIVYTQFFEPFVNDDKDGLQEFGDYNIGVADDTDKIAFIELFDAEDNGTVWKLGSEVIDPVNDTVRIPWSKIVFGSLKVDVAGIGTEHKFNFRVVDTGGDVSDQKGANISNGDFVKLWTPIALDLNGDGKIGVTGETSSRDKDADAELGHTVDFDIDADGVDEQIEWYDGSGDGILVDTSKIGEDGSIDGSALFGDEGGTYADGYEKLKTFDKDGDGQVSGAELDTIGVWVDDGDAVLEDGELFTTTEQGIASVSTEMEIVLDDEGRELLQSTATTLDGQTILTEDVWFAEGDMDSFAEFDGHDMNDIEVDVDCVA